MRIGLDVSQTGAGKAGCGFLAHGLAEALARQGGGHEYVLYPHFGDLYWEPKPKACVHPGPGFIWGPSFRRFEASKRFWRKPGPDFEERLGRPDVVHSNNFYCPKGLAHAKLVYTLYDLSFMENPAWTTEANRVGCADGVFGASLRADYILSISQASLDHFLRIHPHYPRERTAVMPLASRFGPESPRKAPARLKGVEPGEYWLCVGTIEPRKNQERLFEALAALAGVRPPAAMAAEHPLAATAAERTPAATAAERTLAATAGMRSLTGQAARRPLVLAGGRGWLMDDMAARLGDMGLAGRVKLTGYVDDAELAWLYANCFGFVYPSLFEGFGLPVLEAMSLGAPVITSAVSSLPEVAGDAALLVNPHDPASIAAAMARLEADPALRADLSARGLARAALFGWDKAARVALTAYEAARQMPKWSAQP